MTSDANQPDITLDFRSLRCPNLLIAVINQIENARPGQVLQVTASDLNAPSSITSWTRQSEHELLDMYEEGGDFIFLLLRQPIANNQQLITNNQQSTY